MKVSADLMGVIMFMNQDCAVKEAVEEGKIHAVRYEDYKELYEELKNKEEVLDYGLHI